MKINTVLNLIRGEFRVFALKFVLFRNCAKKGAFLLNSRGSFELEKDSCVRIGNKVSLESGSLLACRKRAFLSLGNGVYINRNCSIVSRESITLGNGVTIGPSCCIYDHDHDLKSRGEYITAPILIKENAWIGAGCIILKGVTIGEGAVVAAGTVVTKDVSDHTVVYGKVEYVYKDLIENK